MVNNNDQVCVVFMLRGFVHSRTEMWRVLNIVTEPDGVKVLVLEEPHYGSDTHQQAHRQAEQE